MSYTQSFYHIVFRTKRSEKTIPQESERQLYKYIYTMSESRGCKIYRIGGMEEHVHIFVSLPATMALAVYVKNLKESTSRWLRGNPLFPKFDGWADGYAGLSYGFKDKDMVVRYIMNQKEHHKHTTFREEYQKWLEEMGISIDHTHFLKD